MGKKLSYFYDVPAYLAADGNRYLLPFYGILEV